MNINIIIPQINQGLPSYQNIDPNNIDSITDNSCKNIYIGDTLDYIDNRQAFLEIVTKKLRYGAKLIIEGVDLYEIARAVVTSQIDTVTANNYLYEKKMSVSSITDILEWANDIGLQIEIKHIDNFKYYVELVRPSI